MKARINKYDKACMLVGYYNQDGEYIYTTLELEERRKELSFPSIEF